MPKYQCVFFDLDHTLWDYETNCAEALEDIYHRFRLQESGLNSFPRFLDAFRSINNELWDQYDRGMIRHEEIRNDRFHRILKQVGIDDYKLSLELSHHYVSDSPKRGNLIAGAAEVLEYLSARYELNIITNGFAEIQSTKLRFSGIEHYFRMIVTSEHAGHRKPARGIFDYALARNGFQAQQAVMVGDNLLTDMAGARNAGVDHIFFNPGAVTCPEPVTFEIRSLMELKNIL